MKEKNDGRKCFECELEDDFIADHHVVPRSKGGTKTVPLCKKCHGLVHGRNFLNTSTLTREGLAAAKRRGVKLGAPDPEKNVKLMLAGAQAAKNEFKTKMLPVVNEIMATGVKTLQGVADELERRGYLTRQGKTKWHPGTVRYVLLD
jgi:hypothetical protein